MQIRYLINSITLVKSFNHNFVFFSIILVATFKLTCLTVSQQNYDAVKERRSMSLHTLFILLFVPSFPILYDTSTVTSKTDFVGKFAPSSIAFTDLDCWTGQFSAKGAQGPQIASFLSCQCLNEGLRKELLCR